MPATTIVEELVEDKDEIRRIILDDTKDGRVFKLSEIVDKFNLDLKTTVHVLNELEGDKSLVEQ